MKNSVKVILAVRNLGNTEQLNVFENYDEVYGLYDYKEEIEISQATKDKLDTGDYYAKRYGNTLRAY